MTKRINYPEHPGSTYEEPTYEDPVYQKDNADLLVAIYDYCCRRNYSAALQEYINQTIALLTSKTSNYPYVESLVMNVVSAVDMFAFWEGFKACGDILSGNVFQQIFESLDDEEDDYE